MSPAFLAALADLFCRFVLPFILCAVFVRRWGLSWRTVRLGFLTWLTAMPFLIAVPVIVGIISKGNPVAYVVSLSLTAGLVEETSRYWHYRRTRAPLEEDALRKGALAGIAHGGIETVVLGLQVLFGTIALFFAPQLLPEQMRGIAPDPAFYLIDIVSRLLITFGHMGLALLVWQAVRTRRPVLWLTAIATHIAVDLIAFAQPLVLPGADWLGFAVIILLFAFGLVAYRAWSRPAMTRMTDMTDMTDMKVHVQS